MAPIIIRLALAHLLFLCWLYPAYGQSLDTQRKAFLRAEQSIYQDRDGDYLELAKTLKDYPLYPYLQYQWLKKHLDDDQSVQQFLAGYEQSRYARLLRLKWLKQLGKNQQWALFSRYYRNNDDPELQCLNALAHYQNGQQQTALDAARQFWLSGKTTPAACDPLFAFFKSSPDFTADLPWQRFQAALGQDNLPLAQSMRNTFAEQEHPHAHLWLKLHQHPTMLDEADDWKRTYPLAADLFVHAIQRWLDSDPAAALTAWEAERQNFRIDAEAQTDTDKRLGVALAIKRDTRAYDKLAQIPDKDASTREWMVRAALNQQNWPQVNQAINTLTMEEKQSDKWQYWQARALSALGQTATAENIFLQIAKNRSFYGYMAAYQIHQNPNLTDQPLQVNDTELRQLAQKT
ncbi:MAG: hypothetical protein ABSB19_02590 [Methylomonas sp.]